MVSKLSSSFHTINSDYPLSFSEKYRYLLINFLLGLFPYYKIVSLQAKKFIPSALLVDRCISQESLPISPGRLLSNVFWESINYDHLKQALGGEIRILELGCGSGRYGKRLANIVDIESYKGIDIISHPDWKNLNPQRFEFGVETYENFQQFANSENLIITQSALEHFEKDLKLMQDLDNYALRKSFPVVSIHLVPSACSLFTFLWHGIRQYGRIQIGRLCKELQNSSSVHSYHLGGLGINFFHLRKITVPSVFAHRQLTDAEKKTYFESLAKSLNKDSRSSRCKYSVFTALVIVWNTKNFELKFLDI